MLSLGHGCGEHHERLKSKEKKGLCTWGTFNKARNRAEGHARVSGLSLKNIMWCVCLSHTDSTGCCYNQATGPSRAWQPHPPLVRTVTWTAVRPHPEAPLSIAQGTSCSLWAPRGWAQSQLLPGRSGLSEEGASRLLVTNTAPFCPICRTTYQPAHPTGTAPATPMAKAWGWGFRTQLVEKMSSHSAVFVGRHWVLRTDLVLRGELPGAGCPCEETGEEGTSS